MANKNKEKYDKDRFDSFLNKYNSLLLSSKEVNNILNEYDIQESLSTGIDLIRAYYSYMIYSGAIEELNNQLILYSFPNNTLEYFKYFDRNDGDFIKQDKMKYLIEKLEFNNIDFDSIRDFIINKQQLKTNIKVLDSLFINYNFDRFIAYYSECKNTRNKLAHSIKPNEIEYSNEMCLKYEIVIASLFEYIKRKYL